MMGVKTHWRTLAGQKEIWRPVVGYEGRYEISNFGNVKALGERKITRALSKNGHGYYKITLWKDRKLKTFPIHRLVAFAFLPNPHNKPNINHKNGVKTDNYVRNLEWCTQQHNVIHAHKNNLCAKTTKAAKWVWRMDMDGNKIELYRTLKDASRVGYNSGKISSVCNGWRKSHAGFKWEYSQTK